jgi:hypothetical protein
VRFGKGVVRFVRLGDSHDFGLLPYWWVVAECEARVVDVDQVIFDRIPPFLQEAPIYT